MKVAANVRSFGVEREIIPNYLPVEVVLTVYRGVGKLNQKYQQEIEQLLK
jgi:hypothetical protein